MFTTTTIKSREKAILVGVQLAGHRAGECEQNLQELKQLASTARLEVLTTFTQELRRIHPAHFLGSGKVEELVHLVQLSGAEVVVFDDDLTPAQIRNLEKMLGIKIIDRSTLILDIFARHARTREAKTQVELAQLQHLLPRLTRQWTHLSRQVGGIGTRGPGETQLETDRRLIRRRIEKLRQELEQIDRQRSVRRKNRRNMFRAALIGYTNVGKSTLMNLLSGSQVQVENQLFATLDSTIRRVNLEDNYRILLSDTVGFIRKLPHQLIASFKSTLDEVREADLLLHVVDVSHPQFQEQMQTVMKVLEELNVHHKPMLVLFNKIDQLTEMGILTGLRKMYPESVFISAVRQIGITALREKLLDIIKREFVTARMQIPLSMQKLVHFIHTNTLVDEQEYNHQFVEIQFRCGRAVYHQILKRFQANR